jgi:hypothetical protein
MTVYALLPNTETKEIKSCLSSLSKLRSGFATTPSTS